MSGLMDGNIGTLNVSATHMKEIGDAPPDSRDILGVDVSVMTREMAFESIGRAISDVEHRKYAFLNAHGANIAYKDAEYRSVLNRLSVLSDGIGVDLASRVLHGRSFPANLNGTDFIPGLFSCLDSPAHIALLGARPGVACDAMKKLQADYPRHRFTVAGDGYFDEIGEQNILKVLRDDRPDILLVAFGNPIQEKWIANHCTAEHAVVAIGVGALFDFIAQRVPRAPSIMRRLRIEWLHRLALEPRRMWRRYLLGNPVFLYRVLRQKISGRSPGI